MSTNTVSLHRVIKCTPQKLFSAFNDPMALASWFPPYGYLCVVHEMNFKIGGHYKMSFKNFSTGHLHTFGGEYVEIQENAYIKITDRFDDPDVPGEMTTQVWMNAVSIGTELKVMQEGIPAVIPVEACYLGWQDTLDKLMRLVEPNLPDDM